MPFVRCVPIELVVSQPVLSGIVLEAFPSGKEARKSMQGGNPYPAMLVLHDSSDVVVCQSVPRGVLFENIVIIIFAGYDIKTVPVCTHQKSVAGSGSNERRSSLGL